MPAAGAPPAGSPPALPPGRVRAIVRRPVDGDAIDVADHAYLAPLFVGPAGENGTMLETLLTGFVRDHVYWRRNFHPEDTPAIPVAMRYRADYEQAMARLEQALFKLSADLKKSVPFFAPRYIGHMASDPLLAGLLAQLITTLYNPNNVAHEAAPITLDLELEVGRQLATLLGMDPEAATGPRAFGHITSGGTLANFEALWLLRSARLYPPALAAAARAGLPLTAPLPGDPPLAALDPWQLANFTVTQALDLHRGYLSLLAGMEAAERERWQQCVSAARHEQSGAAFFARHQIEAPRVLAPATAHYSWKKAMTLLGIGRDYLELIPTDRRMRLDCGALDERLAAAEKQKQPVLAVVGVLGTTEFGSIDPVDEILHRRDEWAARGLGFAVHVDAAWGGYLTTMCRASDGTRVSRDRLREQFRYFPSEPVYRAFTALHAADTVTIDPHKLGYVPFGAGALVARDHRLTELVGERPPYLFDGRSEDDASGHRRLRELGDYILEGSKAGSHAAAVWLTHQVVPLDCDHFGRLCRQTVRASEKLYDLLRDLAVRLEPYCRLLIPVEPDTNLICLAVNPAGNRRLAVVNDFGRRLYRHLAVDNHLPLQTRQFIGSHTTICRRTLGNEAAADLAARLGVDAATFTSEIADPARDADHVYLIRHTLMNPWLRSAEGGDDFLTRYRDYLAVLISRELQHSG